MRLHLAEFTKEEIAEKVGAHRSVVSRDLEWIRDSSCPGESPDVQEAYFIQMANMIFNPGPRQFGPRHAPLERTMNPEEAAASWNKRKIYGLVVDGYGLQLNSICNLTQNNADLRRCPQVREDSRKPLQIPASSCKTEELPSENHKPLCDRYSGRWISSISLFGTRGRGDSPETQAGEIDRTLAGGSGSPSITTTRRPMYPAHSVCRCRRHTECAGYIFGMRGVGGRKGVRNHCSRREGDSARIAARMIFEEERTRNVATTIADTVGSPEAFGG
jgi:hypothetical protein